MPDHPIELRAGRFSLRTLSHPTDEELKYLEKWENDASIAHFHHVVSEPNAVPHVTAAELAHRFDEAAQRDRQANHPPTLFWLLELDAQPVGFMSGAIDPPQLHFPVPGALWLGIVIGEEKARGVGLGRQAMLWVEELARQLQCPRIELGVFEFNTVAHHLYCWLGCREIARIPDFTWWNGEMWADIRMEKCLDP